MQCSGCFQLLVFCHYFYVRELILRIYNLVPSPTPLLYIVNGVTVLSLKDL